MEIEHLLNIVTTAPIAASFFYYTYMNNRITEGIVNKYAEVVANQEKMIIALTEIIKTESLTNK